MKATPGPWSTEEGPGGTVSIVAHVEMGSVVVASVPHWPLAPEEAEANARLIAASRELSESLRWMVGAFAEYAEDWDEGSEGMAILNEARALLSRLEARP